MIVLYRVRRRADVLVLATALVLVCPASAAAGLDALSAHAFQFAETQLAGTVTEAGTFNRFPRSTLASGVWQFKTSTDWTSGFFPGCLWLMYESTGNPVWRQRAEAWTASLEAQKNDTTTHDIGFQMLCSYGNGARLTGSPVYQSVLNQAAASLSTRFNPVVGCTRSWSFGSWQFPVIIDNMMNIELLYWSAAHGGPASLRTLAQSHGLRSRLDHVRADGSTFHLIDYNPNSGAELDSLTVQGASNASTWSRGQAWGLYGFTMSYRETGDARFLATAEQLADWFIDHLPADGMPYWDFQAPGIPNEPKDSSAAAIAASGLLELSTLTNDVEARNRYRNSAAAMLAVLCSPAYLAEGTSSHGILRHGTGNKPAASEIDVSLIWGDYYFLQALLRYRALATDTRLPRPTAELGPVRPNPFNPGAQFSFETASGGRVRLCIFDARGLEVRCLADEFLPAGTHVRAWDGTRSDGTALASGTYFVRLETSRSVATRKATLVR